MPIHDTLVSYTNLVKLFGSQDALLAKTHDVAAKVIGDPAKVAAAMADLQTGLDQWRNVEIHPQILHTPHNLTASLLQSHVVRHATIANRIDHFLLKIAGIVLEGLEVRFSDADWPDWAASFFSWIADIVPAVPQPPGPVAEPIANTFSIGVLGDFGTGLYGAPICRYVDRMLPGQNDAGQTVPIPGAWIYDTNNLYIPDFATRFAPNGFLRLEFDGAHLVEFVRSPGGANVWLEELTPAG